MAGAWYGTGLVQLALDALEHVPPDRYHFHIGGAVGWDLAVGVAAVRWGIPFTLHLPKKHRSVVEHHSLTLYDQIVSYASNVLVYGERTDRNTLMARNIGIVDSSSVLLVMWDGKVRGGTSHAIRYCSSQAKPVFNFYPCLAHRMKEQRNRDRKSWKPF